MIRRRNLTKHLLWTILTFGLYSIIWFYTISEDTGEIAEDSTMYGALTLLFMLITCGIYKIYWSYKIGKLLYEAKKNANINAINNSILYTIFSLFGFDIINYCIMQSELNDLAVI